MLTAASIYLAGIVIALLYAVCEGVLKAYRSTVLAAAIFWPVVVVTFLGAWLISTYIAIGEMRESKRYFKRSWPRVIRDYPVMGRIYKFFSGEWRA